MNIKRVYGSILARKTTLVHVSSSSPSASISVIFFYHESTKLPAYVCEFLIFQKVYRNISKVQEKFKNFQRLYIRDNENRIERRINLVVTLEMFLL